MSRNIDLFAIGFLLLAILVSSRMRNVVISCLDFREMAFKHYTRMVVVPVPVPAAPPAPLRAMRD